jgi:drug/metabolite transporter (DMT)-like permease
VKWLLVGCIVACTVLGDLLQSHGMRRGGRAWKLPLSVAFMAASFFSLTQLLKIADLSFAVPATALSLVIETVLAGVILRERVTSRRWAGALLVTMGVFLISR